MPIQHISIGHAHVHFGATNPPGKPAENKKKDSPPVSVKSTDSQAKQTTNPFVDQLTKSARQFGNNLVTLYRKHIGFESDDHKIDHYLSKARESLMKGYITQVFKTFEWAKNKKPNRLETHLQIGRLLSEMIQYKQVGYLNETHRQEQLKGKEFQELKEGLHHIPVVDLEKEALKAYEAAHQLEPTLPEPMIKLAELHESRKDLEVAKGYLKQLTQLNPEEPAYFAKLGEFYDRQGNLDKAIHKLNRAVELNSKNEQYHATLGELYFKKGDTQKAEQHLVQATQLNSSQPTTFLKLSELYKSQERHAEAANAAQKAAQLLLEREKVYNPKKLN